MTAPARTKIQKLESNGEHLQIKQSTSGFSLWESKVLRNPLNSLANIGYSEVWERHLSCQYDQDFNPSFIFVMDKTDSGKRLCYLHVSTVAFQFLNFCSGWRGHLWPTKDRQKSKIVRKLRVNNTNKNIPTSGFYLWKFILLKIH